MYEHNALGYWSGLALCLTKVRSSRARCPATALIFLCMQNASFCILAHNLYMNITVSLSPLHKLYKCLLSLNLKFKSL